MLEEFTKYILQLADEGYVVDIVNDSTTQSFRFYMSRKKDDEQIECSKSIQYHALCFRNKDVNCSLIEIVNEMKEQIDNHHGD